MVHNLAQYVELQISSSDGVARPPRKVAASTVPGGRTRRVCAGACNFQPVRKSASTLRITRELIQVGSSRSSRHASRRASRWPRAPEERRKVCVFYTCRSCRRLSPSRRGRRGGRGISMPAYRGLGIVSFSHAASEWVR